LPLLLQCVVIDDDDDDDDDDFVPDSKASGGTKQATGGAKSGGGRKLPAFVRGGSKVQKVEGTGDVKSGEKKGGAGKEEVSKKPEDMDVKELKALLKAKGVDTSDCVEKSDLVAKLGRGGTGGGGGGGGGGSQEDAMVLDDDDEEGEEKEKEEAKVTGKVGKTGEVKGGADKKTVKAEPVSGGKKPSSVGKADGGKGAGGDDDGEDKPKKKFNPYNREVAAVPNPHLKQEKIDSHPGSSSCLDGLTFVVTGVLDSLERAEATDLIQVGQP
jgi:NAD-dependent DNA ligase